VDLVKTLKAESRGIKKDGGKRVSEELYGISK